MDKTITLLLQLSLITPFVTVLVAALVACGFLRGNLRWPALLGVSLSSLIGLTAVIYFSPLLPEQSYSQPLIHWLTLSSKPAFSLKIGVLFDSLSLTFYLFLSLAALSVLLLSLPEARGSSEQAHPRSAALLFLMCFFATTGIVLATNFLQLFFFWCLLSMSLNLLHEVNLRSEAGVSESTRRHWWGWNAWSDAMLLLALFLIQTNFESLEFLTVLQPAALTEVMSQNRTALPGIVAILLFATLPRAGLFPASSLLVSQQTPWRLGSLAALNLLALPAGLYLLMRCAPFYLAVPAGQILLAQLGTASALLTVFSALSLPPDQQPDRSLSWLAGTLAGFAFAALGLGQAGTLGGTLAMVVLELSVLAILISLAGWQQRGGLPAHVVPSIKFCVLILLCVAVVGLTGLLSPLVLARATPPEFRTELLVWLIVPIGAGYVTGLARFYFSLSERTSHVGANFRFPVLSLWCVTAGIVLLSVVLLFPLPFVPTIWPGPILGSVPLLFEQDWLLCSLFGVALLVSLILTWMTAGHRDSLKSNSEPPALIQLGQTHYYALSLLDRAIIQPLQLLARVLSLTEEWIVRRLSRFSLEKIPDYWGSLLQHMQNGQAAFSTLILLMTLSVIIFVLMVLQI